MSGRAMRGGGLAAATRSGALRCLEQRQSDATPPDTDPTDMELAEAVRVGDDDAFGLPWERHHDAGVRAARAITTRFDTERMVQEAFARTLTGALVWLRARAARGGPDRVAAGPGRGGSARAGQAVGRRVAAGGGGTPAAGDHDRDQGGDRAGERCGADRDDRHLGGRPCLGRCGGTGCVECGHGVRAWWVPTAGSPTAPASSWNWSASSWPAAALMSAGSMRTRRIW